MKRLSLMGVVVLISLVLCSGAFAQEVEKAKIPEDQLADSFKNLAWGAPIWDAEEAIARIKAKGKTLWIDTRPQSFYEKGTVRGAILLPYNKQGEEGNDMTKETLDKAVADAGINPATDKIVMFCQGPKCHRSYNGTFMAITEWGYPAENVVWFRAGYPLLLKAVKEDPKLKRKAKKYISDAGLKEL